MRGLPVAKGFAQTLAHLMDSGLGQQSQAHLAVADMKIECPGPMPTQSLIAFEELFDMPALGVMDGEILYFIAIGGGAKRFIKIIGWPFSAALGETIVRFRATAVLEPKGGFSGGIAGPAGNKAFRGQSLALDFWRVVRRHGHQQLKGGLQMNVIEEFARIMLAISQHQRG